MSVKALGNTIRSMASGELDSQDGAPYLQWARDHAGLPGNRA